MELLGRISIDRVKSRYSGLGEIWADSWHKVTRKLLEENLIQLFEAYFPSDSRPLILNVGSAGDSYIFPLVNHVHSDLCINRLAGVAKSVVCDGQKLPFKASCFDIVACLGSVINYTNAIELIAEMSRVIIPRGKLFLEFERSESLEFIGTPTLATPAALIATDYQDSLESIWVYSDRYIKDSLEACRFRLVEFRRFGISQFHNELRATVATSETEGARTLSEPNYMTRFSPNAILVAERVP